MDKSTLNDLITSSIRNDEKAFRIIVETYQSMIYSLSFRLLCNEEEAKDTVQETFLRVWLNLNKYQSDKKFSTWIYAIASNLCLDKLKNLKHNQCSNSNDESINYMISSDNIEQTIINKELAEIILKLTDNLTPKQKIVFILRYLEDIEVNEIVQITGMPPNKIKSNLFLARQSIRRKLETL
ncbi:MAG: sigma-70 family RNA polymerase sigma factor [Paludibacter sp.]|nr:sigma-70 family RNA polymerase sigma factor [Paludibacter sp.]